MPDYPKLERGDNTPLRAPLLPPANSPIRCRPHHCRWTR